MANYKVISSDSHVVEPPNLWVERMDRARFGDKIPHLVEGEPFDFWYAENKKAAPVGAITQAGLRFERPQDIIQEGKFGAVRPGGYIPVEHVKDMDEDGVYGGVVYPSIGLSLYEKLEDPELTRETFAAYNDWLAEFCSADSKRLKGAAMLLVEENVGQAVEELRRIAEMGLTSAMISSYPRVGLTYDKPLYEPFWSAAEELDVTLNLHVTTNRPTTDPGLRGDSAGRIASWVQHDYWARMCLCHIIFSGVLERHPKLKFANVEHELGWLPFFMHRIDVAYREKQQSLPMRFKTDATPSDFMRSNVYHSFQEDAMGIQFRHVIGVDNLMWGSDYPHSESTFPKSLEILDRILKGVPEKERAKIAGGNTAKVYKFD
ncbi:MAG: amidohydrolase [SAR202 cluster bacterium]|nr:amidohydrolase [SAR202 cluster bacterium]